MIIIKNKENSKFGGLFTQNFLQTLLMQKVQIKLKLLSFSMIKNLKEIKNIKNHTFRLFTV